VKKNKKRERELVEQAKAIALAAVAPEIVQDARVSFWPGEYASVQEEALAFLKTPGVE